MSFLNKMRKMVGMEPKREEETLKAEERIDADAFNALSEEFFVCEDDAQRAAIWEQMCKALPQTLFLATMCYQGEDPNTPVNDRDLHVSVGAKGMLGVGEAVVTRGNPGYSIVQKKETRRIQLNTLIYNKTKEEWVPLFTDFTKLLPVFGQTRRMMVITFREARKIARPYKGIVINPGKNGIRISTDMMKNIR